jgi:nucleotide-binding universal stress UspA family protein
MFKKILVPLDGSKLAERALHSAITLAQHAGGEVILLSIPVLKHLFVVDGAAYGMLLPNDSLVNSRKELTEYLEAVKEKLPYNDFALHTRVVDGDEASVIVETAVTENVDLIIMSTHGYSGLTRWMLGSVTEKVLRSTPCPVMAVRSGAPIANILITLDGSELAEHSLSPGLEMARLVDGKATLLRVEHGLGPHISTFGQFHQPIPETLANEDDFTRQLYQAAKVYLQNLVDKHKRTGLSIEKAVIFAPAANGILDFAEDQAIDLIVMTTHGRTGLAHWVYGSVTEKVMRGAHCAVLIIPSPAHQLN